MLDKPGMPNVDVGASARCPLCGRRWPRSRRSCPVDGSDLLDTTERRDLHVRERFLLPGRRLADETALEDDTDLHIGARPAAITSGSLTAVNETSSDEFTAETPRAIESASPPSPPSAQPASDPTTSTRLDPGFVHLVPGTLVGEYEVEKLLGSGGMGAVYGARHERLGRRAAIKVIAPSLSVDADAVERFEQESQALALLSHPNIVDVLSVGTLPGDGRSYFVMAWLDGESLHDRLERGRVPTDDALDILDQIARGLDAAHAAGIVHRDLKPDNVWLQRVGTEERPIVRLIDYGLAKLAEHRRSEDTTANAMFGTAAYMSPEQCRSARDVGAETDVYALGCVAYEMLCGRLPFDYDSVAELVVAHQTEDPPRPRQLAAHLDPALDALLLAMLAKDPRRRPTVEQVRERLAHSRMVARVESRPSAAPPVSSTPPRADRRSRVMLGAGVVTLLVVAVALAARGRTEAPRIEQRVDSTRLDGGMENHQVATPLDAPAPVVVSAPAIDASVAGPRVDAGSGTATTRRKPRSSPADAAVATDDSTSSVPASPDAGQPETPTSVIAAERIESAPRHQAPSPESKPSKALGKQRTTLERSPNRDQTFNPFERKSR